MKIALTAAVSALVLAALPALAAEKTQTVMFKKGTTSAMLSGSVKGYDTMSYMLGASAGQVMSMQFAPQRDAGVVSGSIRLIIAISYQNC